MRIGRAFPARPLTARSREGAPATFTDMLSSGVADGSLALTAPTQIPPDASSGLSSASLTLGAGGTQTMTLSVSTGLSAASLVLTAPTQIVLDTSVAFSRATLELANRIIVAARASEIEVVAAEAEDFAVDRAYALDADT